MTWVEGRKLDTVTVNGQTYTYVYNADGQRVKKINPDGSYIEYYVMDGITVGESHFTATGSKTLGIRYTLDENGTVVGFTMNGVNYYFAKNLQGDVLAVYNATTNELAAEYTYDSWGNILTATGTLAETNPFRYRGYYYDEETNFYYLQSRYYDAAIGRFINADSLVYTGQGILGYNMFSYCGNNPVMGYDPTGEINLSAIPEGLRTVVKYVRTLKMSYDLYKMGFNDYSLATAHECLYALSDNGIDTAEERAHFFAQCYVEGNLSVLEAGYLSEIKAEEYRKKQPYYPFYGAGYIQITWEANYKLFSEDMNDPLILEKGPQYVAENYAWRAAGWYWSENSINSRIAKGASVADVTRIVNGANATSDTITIREQMYSEYLKYFGG